MGRLLRAFLCVMLALSLLSSCGSPKAENAESGKKSENNYLADKKFDTDEFLEDFDAGYLVSPMAVCCESPDAYYMFSNRLMVFYDKASGISGPLCAKPECVHGILDFDCNAYIGVNCFCMAYYDGRVYWIAHDESLDYYLYSCATDGTDRKQIAMVREFPPSNEDSSSGWMMFCHRGYCYVAYGAREVENGESVNHIHILAVSLETGERIDILDDLGASSTPGDDFGMQAVGNDIYMLSYDVSDESDIPPVIIRVFHSKTRELETLCRFTPAGYISAGNLMVTPEREIYIGTRDRNGYYTEKINVEANSSEVLFSTESDYALYFAEDCILQAPRMNNDGTVEFAAWNYDGSVKEVGVPKFEAGAAVNKNDNEMVLNFTFPSVVKDGEVFGQTWNDFFVRFALDGSYAEMLWDANTIEIG